MARSKRPSQEHLKRIKTQTDKMPMSELAGEAYLNEEFVRGYKEGVQSQRFLDAQLILSKFTPKEPARKPLTDSEREELQRARWQNIYHDRRG